MKKSHPHHRPTLAALLTALLCCVSLNATHAAEAVIAKRVAIELPANPSKTEQFAAEELRRYLSAMGITLTQTGQADATLVVGRTPENTALTEGRFTPGLAGNVEDGFVIHTQSDGTVRLVGGKDRGTLYAAYTFLESQDCRFFGPDELWEHVPTKDTLTLQPGEAVHTPSNLTREIGGGATEQIGMYELVDWGVKNRINRRFALRPGLLYRAYSEPERRTAWDRRGGMQQWHWIAHNFAFIFSHEEDWFGKHPEYFALYQGRRLPMGSNGKAHYGGGNLALTNPSVIDHCIDFGKQWFDKNPGGLVYPLWPNDGAVKWDESPEAMALGGRNFTPGEEGSMSRRMTTFVNKVAKELNETHPDRLVLLPAYSNYLLPVEGVTHEPNVFVQYCYHGDYAHAPDKSEENREAAEHMKAWASQSKHFGVWEYYLIGDIHGRKTVPVHLPLVYRTRDTMQFLERVGSTRYFTQANNIYQPYNPLLFYALSRYMWDPNLDADAMIDDFALAMYGVDAGPHMAAYYKAAERSCQASNWTPSTYAEVAAPSPLVFTTEIVAEMETLLAKAESCDLTDKQRARLAQAREAFEGTRGSLKAQQLVSLDPDTSWRLERHDDFYVVNADGQEAPAERFEELRRDALDRGRYTPQLDQLLFRAQRRREPIVKLETDTLQAAIVPGLGGRLVRLIDKTNLHNFIMERPSGDTLDAIAQRYFPYGGYEEYVGHGFAGPGWELAFEAEPIEGEPNAVKLTAETEDWRLERVYRLLDGESPSLEIISTLTNTTAAPQTLALRGHPQFDMGPDAKTFEVIDVGAGGERSDRDLAAAHDQREKQAQGRRGVWNPANNLGLVIEQATDGGDRYTFVADDQRYFHLELFSRKAELQPGEAIVMSQRLFPVVRDRARFDRLVSGASAASAPAPQIKTYPLALEGRVGDYADGVAGTCATFGPHKSAGFPESPLRANSGAIEAWVKLDPAASLEEGQWLISQGNNVASWLFLVANAEGVSLLSKAGKAPYQSQGEHYMSVHAPWADPASAAGVWHHVAASWVNNGSGESSVAIYLNGKLSTSLHNATLGDSFAIQPLFIGRSSARAADVFMGQIDEVRLSHRPRTAAEIADAYARGKAGAAVAVDPATAALVHFDDNLEAVLAPRAGSTAEARARWAAQMRKEDATP